MTMYQPEPNEAARRAVASAIHGHWILFLVEGVVLVLLGAAAIILPVIATLAFTAGCFCSAAQSGSLRRSGCAMRPGSGGRWCRL